MRTDVIVAALLTLCATWQGHNSFLLDDWFNIGTEVLDKIVSSGVETVDGMLHDDIQVTHLSRSTPQDDTCRPATRQEEKVKWSFVVRTDLQNVTSRFETNGVPNDLRDRRSKYNSRDVKAVEAIQNVLGPLATAAPDPERIFTKTFDKAADVLRYLTSQGERVTSSSVVVNDVSLTAGQLHQLLEEKCFTVNIVTPLEFEDILRSYLQNRDL